MSLWDTIKSKLGFGISGKKDTPPVKGKILADIKKEERKPIKKHPVPWQVGDKIEDRYEIHDIKMGGMGIVYLCYDHEFKEPVAIKTFQDKYQKDKDSKDRFIHEANTWVDLGKHKNIVQAKYVKHIEYCEYIFLEYVRGSDYYGADLSGWIKLRGLDLKQSLNFAIQFCNGMIHAEKKFKKIDRPFIHRDIKPANIMVTKDKVVKVSDFGLVKTFEEKREGLVCGTPPYMSPEQYIGLNVDIRSDIYAFGCVLYEMTTGQPPFKCPSFDVYKAYHLRMNPQPLSTIDEDLNKLVMRCLKKAPEKRYSGFTELREELSKIYFKHTEELIKEEDEQKLTAWEIENKGTALTSLGRYREAIICYEEALKIDSKCVTALVGKGETLGMLGKDNESLLYFDKALEIDPRNIEAWNDKAIQLDRCGKFYEVLDSLDKGLKINPKSTLLWANKGILLYDHRMYREAIVCFDETLKIDPNSIAAWTTKGNILGKFGKYEEAIFCFGEVLKINPVVAEAWNNRGLALEYLGKTEEAIVCYDEAIKCNPEYELAWHNKGVILDKVGRYEESEFCFEKASQLKKYE